MRYVQPRVQMFAGDASRRLVASSGAVRSQFSDGRWHFQHGPIDLIIGADGDAGAIAAAVQMAWLRFQSMLSELVGELPILRLPIEHASHVQGEVARRMVAACHPHRDMFITPMAAVAGAVADELIESFRIDERIVRAHINNGGDIALHLTPGYSYRVGIYADLNRLKRREILHLDGDIEIAADTAIRGVATSGWRGRSSSLGIADSVTVLANCAACADAAATLIANSVDIDDPVILRRPARELKDDSDLGERLVTVGVGRLSQQSIACALDAGEVVAQSMCDRQIIDGAALWLAGQARIVGKRNQNPASRGIRMNVIQ